MQLISFTPLAIVGACLGGSFAILANMLCFIMIGKINERVPQSERISYLWWGGEVRGRFKQLYPGNRLVLLLDSCMVMLVLCFIFLLKVWAFRAISLIL
jgi:hypothetical protein